MAAAEVARVVNLSTAVVDVEHPRQRGFTMRTIECLLAGKKLVTTNRHIMTSDLYHPSRVHLIARGTPEIPANFIAQPCQMVSDILRQRYSCEGWIAELLNVQAGARMQLRGAEPTYTDRQ